LKIGDEVTLVEDRGGREVTIKGRLRGLRLTGTTMHTPEGDFPGISFLVNDHWTVTFALRNEIIVG